MPQMAAAEAEGCTAVARTVVAFFCTCVENGTSDVFQDLRDWGLSKAVLSLVFHAPQRACAALLATLTARDGECVDNLPPVVAEMLRAAQVTLADDLDDKVRAVAHHALRKGTEAQMAADGATADKVHRATMHLLVAFMGMGLTAADVRAAAAQVCGARASSSFAQQGYRQGCDRKADVPGGGAGASPVSAPKQAPAAAPVAVPVQVKELAEEFVRAAHWETVEDQWVKKLRDGILRLSPEDASRLYFCPTRTGSSVGRSYWERVFESYLVDARTVLDMLRAFDVLGVPILLPLENGVQVRDLAQRRARQEDAFDMVVAWLRAARVADTDTVHRVPGTRPRAPGARRANTACPLALAPRPRAGDSPGGNPATAADAAADAAAAFVEARQRAEPADACVVCGRIELELRTDRIRRERVLAAKCRTGAAREGLTGAELLCCGRCKGVWYCSPVCQKWHWTRWHNAECAAATSATV